MTKRDSARAGIDSPRGPMSLQRRQLTVSVQHSRAVVSSDHHPTGDQSQASWSSNQHHSGTTELGDTPSSAPHFGYTSDIPPVPMPSGSQWYPQGEAYPLQSEIQKQNKVLHTHIFKKIVIASWIEYPRSPGSDRSGSSRRRTEQATGVLLQWNRWSCQSGKWGLHRQLATSHSPCQLLASFLRHSRTCRQLPTLAPAVATV